MNVEKLPSGSFRLRKTVSGKRFTVTLDHKPTKKEIEQIASDMLTKKKPVRDVTFKEASEEYIASRKNVLSPSTIQGYRAILRRIPDEFMEMKLSDITQAELQRFVNESSARHSPKTVANEHGFIVAVIRFLFPEASYSTRLPKKRQDKPHIPSEEDFMRVYEAMSDRYKIAFALTAYGLRRSEVCALTMDDIEDNKITVNKAVVLDENNKWVLKNTPKSEAGNRVVFISSKLADEIRTQGLIFDGNPSQLSNAVNRAIKHSGVEHFSLHKMRHYFASHAHQLGIPEADILKMGGWESDYVMKSHYRHSLSHEESAKRYAEDIDSFF